MRLEKKSFYGMNDCNDEGATNDKRQTKDKRQQDKETKKQNSKIIKEKPITNQHIFDLLIRREVAAKQQHHQPNQACTPNKPHPTNPKNPQTPQKQQPTQSSRYKRIYVAILF